MKLNTPPPPQETVINNVEQATGESNLPSTQPYRRLYMAIPVKFPIPILLAIAWTTLSVWLSKRWLIDLANITNWPFAIIAITFIAYVPGFMNAFLISTLAFDRRPPRKKLTEYPGVTILVAAYNEAHAISDTLTSLSRQDYKGELEISCLTMARRTTP